MSLTNEEFKESIKSYKDIVRGINDLKSRIKNMDCRPIVKDSVKGSAKEFPFVQHTCVIEGRERNSKLEKRKRLLKKKQNELEEIKYKIEVFLNTQIKDERMRQILEYRYIDGYSWIKIAFRVEASSEEAVRKEVERFLKKL